ncbi:MAG: hypothetical protein RDV48_11800 [Candidatus Eremiobacteraeota bacterium]|nr:hypothetical protein [Candidatus Eremiobacteraeota bacterium]
MERPDFDKTLRAVVNDGLVVCLNAFENIHTNLYLLLQHLRCLVEDTKTSEDFDSLNDTLFSFYSAVSASHRCLSEVDESIKEIAEWLENEETKEQE